MKNINLHIFIIFLSANLSHPSISFGQNTVLFNRITADDGLATNNVRCFLQDYQGFMWIGTEDGLHRFDGYTFKNYRNIPEDQGSLGGNFIMSLYEDSSNRLWIGMLDAGLSIYDRESDRFYTFKNDPEDEYSIFGNTISSFFETEDGLLWIATEQGGLSYIRLDSFDLNQPKFHNIYLAERFTSSGILWIREILPAGAHTYWLGIHGAGLVLFDSDKEQFTQIIRQSDFPDVEIDQRFTTIYKDSKGRLWLGTWNGGLYAYYPDEHRILVYQSSEEAHSISNNHIAKMTEDKHGNFWVGTDDGLCRMLDFKEKYPPGKFEIFKNDLFDEHSIKTNSIKNIYCDDNDRIWVANYFGGISVYDPDYLRFQTIRHHPLKKNSLPGNNVTAMAEDKQGNIYIGLDGDGLCFLPGGSQNIGLDIFEKIELLNSETGLPENKIKCIEIDDRGMVWIGTWGGGLFRYNPATRTYKHLWYGKGRELPVESVISLESLNDKLWIGTFNGGLVCYDQVSGQIDYYKYDRTDEFSLPSNKINALMADHNNRLWIGTESGGLSYFDAANNQFRRIQLGDLPRYLNVMAIYECHDHFIWIGTHSHGLLRLNPVTMEIEQFDRKFGLSVDLIQSIAEDHDHYLWVGTNGGISKFVFSQNEVTNFSMEEGLQSRQFNLNSALVCRDGRMLFGGINGLNAFYPSDIRKSESKPPLIFTGFSLDNEPVTIGGKQSPLEKNIIVSDKVSIFHNHNSFSIEYAALEFDFSRRTRYITLLEGFDNGWQHRGTERKVTYTNLNPGRYTLHVKPINKDGFASDQVSTLLIRVYPAWYETPVFLVSMILLLVGGLYAFVQFRINFFKNQRVKLEKKVATRTRELNEKSKEILAQNEELQAQHDQILLQREALESAKDQLTSMNNQLERLVRKRTKKLEKTINELDRFVYSASHDLSAPLKSVLGLLNIAKIDPDPRRISEYLKYIEESILKLEEVIKSLISYSRNTRLDLKPEYFNLYDLVTEVINGLAFLPTNNQISFEIEIDRQFNIKADRSRLQIVLHNLISNSIKYADPEKNHSFVRIECVNSDSNYTIKITDNGIGIDKELLPKIFNMFYRATEKSDGSGLGLFIVKETLNAMGGKISVESKTGQWTVFTLNIPV